MPVIGTRERHSSPTLYGQGKASVLREYASKFCGVSNAIRSEAKVNIANPSECSYFLKEEASYGNPMKDFFLEDCVINSGSMTPEEIEDQRAMMEAYYENDASEILNEYAPLAQFNPVIGLTFPMHKLILMNCVWDKALPKTVLATPKTTFTMQHRYLVDPVTNKEVDIVKEQGKIKDTVNKVAPFKEIEILFNNSKDVDLIAPIGGVANVDNISLKSHISQVKVEITKHDDSTEEVWVPVKDIYFRPSYGKQDRTLTEQLSLTHENHVDSSQAAREPITGTVFGFIKDNKMTIMTDNDKIKGIKFKARKDTTNGIYKAASVTWRSYTDIIEIADGIPINTTVHPDEIKDIAATYGVDTIANIMETSKDVLVNYKDDTIRDFMDTSYAALEEDSKFGFKFDFAPTNNYALTPVEYREKMFFDQFDILVTDMMRALNDPNMTIASVGPTNLIRRLKPTNYQFDASPEAVGAIPLEFTRNVMTSDQRVYQFVSSQKMDVRIDKSQDNEIITFLKPNGTNRVVYMIFDYSLVTSNDIRNSNNPALPAVNAYERWDVKEYQPVQARVKCLNITGLK